MEQMKQNEIARLESSVKVELTSLADNDEAKKAVVSTFMSDIDIVFSECKEWLKTNIDPEVIEPRIQKLKDDSEKLITKAKDKLQDVTNRPEVREKLHEGKEIVKVTSSKVAHVVNESTQEFLKQENVKKIVNKVHGTVSAIANDERVKEGVSSFKKNTLKVAENAFNGLKKILDDETTTDEDKQ